MKPESNKASDKVKPGLPVDKGDPASKAKQVSPAVQKGDRAKTKGVQSD